MKDAVTKYPPPFIERQTLCLAGTTPGIAAHAGEHDFAERLRRHYDPYESNIAEKLVHFKAELVRLDGEAFWGKLMEGMTDICDAQFAFVSKRILVEDQKTAIEMPPIGEVGSCLMAVALYFNDGKGTEGNLRDYQYYAWSAPCAYMKHDKVFVIPEELSSFITNNPNALPFQPEAYLGVPLFAENKCFAHFGMMWTKEALARIQGVSWVFLEMFMHSIEDLICEKLLSGQGFQKKQEKSHRNSESARVIPQSAIMVTQSLKPYARSLSHELRTPMQGVVGMLDVMYTTVQEQIEGQSNPKVRQIFQTLKDSIEVIQDSSKRAVEAADNVVQAYDLNMQVPETPSIEHAPNGHQIQSYFDSKPIMSQGGYIVDTSVKRKRSDVEESNDHRTKIRAAGSEESISPRSVLAPQDQTPSPMMKSPPLFNSSNRPKMNDLPRGDLMTSPEHEANFSSPSTRHSNIREVLPVVINDSLRVGGRPDYAVSEPAPFGERIEVRTRSSNGHTSEKIVTWAVEADVPQTLPLDERDLSKLIGAVFLNAIKFTDNGTISITVKLSTSKRYCVINVIDTGTGIPETFRSELFKPFSQEDDSLTRTREGLGLGLLVAKGLARRVGGDITLVRTSVEGLDHGSDFEIRVPLEAGEYSSRATTPFSEMANMNAPRSVPTTAAGSSLAAAIAAHSRPASPRLTSSTPRADMSPSRMTTPTIIDIGRRPSLTNHSVTSETGLPVTHKQKVSTSRTPTVSKPAPDRDLGKKHPLKIMVAEDNKLNRKLLINMLGRLGYKGVYEAFDGVEAVRVMSKLVQEKKAQPQLNGQSIVDVILMDLWMPGMDGYQATEKILQMYSTSHDGVVNGENLNMGPPPKILAVSADVTDNAIDKAAQAGMQGYLTKPYNLMDLQKLIIDFCIYRATA